MNRRTYKIVALMLTAGTLLQAAGCAAILGDSVAQILFSTILQQLVSGALLAVGI